MTVAPSFRVVVDTNVFVPAAIAATAAPPRSTAGAGLLRAWRAGFCSLIVSDELLAEYREILQRAPFNITSGSATLLIGQVRKLAIVVSPKATKAILKRDPDDDMVLKTALAGKAHFLVTDNRRDFEELVPPQRKLAKGAQLAYRGVRVVGLSDCLDAIRAAHPDAGQVMGKKSRWP